VQVSRGCLHLVGSGLGWLFWLADGVFLVSTFWFIRISVITRDFRYRYTWSRDIYVDAEAVLVKLLACSVTSCC